MAYKNHPAKLILFCGLPGSGKTTLAKQIAAEAAAVRLCPDDWMADLGIDLFDEDIRTKLEGKLWKLGQELLRLGINVILENGLWSRQERDDKRLEAEGLGVVTEMHYMDVPFDELVQRLGIRNVSGGHGTVPVSLEQITEYAGLFQAPDQKELALYTKSVVHET
jgi:predicted kinase